MLRVMGRLDCSWGLLTNDPADASSLNQYSQEGDFPKI